jgi:hypothetical protein
MVALRKLLGPRAIATIPGRGYRFALPIDAVSGGSFAASAPPSAAMRGNLPASPPLFGRAQDLDAMHALLREHAVVSIVGAAGIGKTRLALAAAAAVRFEWPDGRWWVLRRSTRTRSQQHRRSVCSCQEAAAGSA